MLCVKCEFSLSHIQRQTHTGANHCFHSLCLHLNMEVVKNTVGFWDIYSNEQLNLIFFLTVMYLIHNLPWAFPLKQTK